MSKFDRIFMNRIYKINIQKVVWCHLALAVVFFTFSSAALAGDSRCATANEARAINNRVVQSELMVAALSCKKEKSYKSFLNKFKSEIKQDKKSIRGYFSRVYNDKSEQQLNGFITKIANKSSERSLSSSSQDFCMFADHLFEMVLDDRTNSIVRVSSDRYFSGVHNIKNCESNQRKWL